ncbi:Protein kinase, partial [Coemansia spiralis]
ALESQMYKMRLRGPHALAGGGSADGAAAGRVQSPLVPSQPSPLVPSQPSPQKTPAATAAAAVLAQQAVGSSGNGPSGTPPNYFRVALPPLAGTPGNLSNSSSISSLAHASLKAQPTSNNPYSHRTDSATMSGATGNAPAAASSDVDMKPESSESDGAAAAEAAANDAAGAVRKPTVMRKRAKTTRTRWHFGIRSRSPPADVMAEVYRALQQLNMTWKHFNPYHLRAKYTRPAPPGSAGDPVEVKIDLQLFRLDTRDNYLVDFKAVIPPVRGAGGGGGGGGELGGDAGPTYRAGKSTLISPMPPFIQAARRRMSAAPRPATYVDRMAADPIALAMLAGGRVPGMEPRSLDDQFLDANYPIQLPAEVPAPVPMPANMGHDNSDMLPRPETLPARSVQRFVGNVLSSSPPPQLPAGGGSSDSMSVCSDGPQDGGIPIPGSVNHPRGLDIPGSRAMAGSLRVGSVGSPGHTMGGTPRSQGRAPGSYMPGSVVGRVSLARADVSLTADGVGAGSGPSQQAQERVVNIFPFLDVCCRLITELAVPHK